MYILLLSNELLVDLATPRFSCCAFFNSSTSLRLAPLSYCSTSGAVVSSSWDVELGSINPHPRQKVKANYYNYIPKSSLSPLLSDHG